MLEFVVCDDESNMIKRVSDIIDKTMKGYNYEYNVLTFNDYDSKFKNYVANNKKGVIYILDIEMPSESGINIARYIRNIDKESLIIILTSHHEIADEIYKGRLNILTFISKRDKCDENLILAVKDSITYFIEDKDIVSFFDLGNRYSISAKDILYIIKDGRKTLIKTNQCEYEVYTSLDKMKKYLPNYFKQSHRSCIVNMKRVNKINYRKRLIYFDNGEFIDYIGNKYKKELVI